MRASHFMEGLTIEEVSAIGAVRLEASHVAGDLRLQFDERGSIDLFEFRAMSSERVSLDAAIAAEWFGHERNGRQVFY